MSALGLLAHNVAPCAHHECVVDLEPSVRSLLFGSEVLIDLMDVDELGVIDVVTCTFESDRGAACGEDVLEPVGVRPIGQGDDEPVVGPRGDDRRVVAASAGSPDVLDDCGR